MKIRFLSCAVRATALGLAFGLGAAGSVSAQIPVDIVDLPAGEGCSFPLRITSTGAPLEAKVFTDKAGNPVRSIAAGRGVQLTFTNLTSGATLSFKAQGSVAKQTLSPDGMTTTVVATGQNGLILFPTDIPAGPTATLYVGRVVYTVDNSNGVFTLLGTSGKSTDICAFLS